MEHPIRVLKRPDQPSSNLLSEPHRQPAISKTLEQREADYAAARKRIMESSTPEPALVAVDENVNLCHTSEKQLTDSMPVVTNVAAANFSNHAKGNQNKDFIYNQTISSNGFFCSDGRRLINSNCNMQLSTNGNQSQQRPMTTTCSSPLITNHLTSNSTSLAPFHTFQIGYNTGLLPATEARSSYPNVSNNGGNYQSQINVLHLMQQFNSLQQHYQQLLNGMQNRLTVSTGNSSETFNQFNLQPSFSRPAYYKFAFPPAFN